MTSMRKKILSLLLATLMILSTAAPVLAELVAVVTVEEEEQSFEAGELVDGDGSYTIRVSYGEDAEIPEGAELITSEVSDPDAYLAAAEDSTKADEEVSFARFFDVAIIADGEQIQPKAPVEVTIECEELNEVAEEESVSVVQFQAEETAEELVEAAIEAALEEAFGLKAEKPAEGIGRYDLDVQITADVEDVFEEEETLPMEQVEVTPDSRRMTAALSS